MPNQKQISPGDTAWLTVPSRDSAGYSKRGIGHFTIPVTVKSIKGRNATVTPTHGGGEASVAIERLAPTIDLSLVSTRRLIQLAYDHNLLRHQIGPIDWSQEEVVLDLTVTGFTGIEFTYVPEDDVIVDAWRTIDGTNLEPAEFVSYLCDRLEEHLERALHG